MDPGLGRFEPVRCVHCGDVIGVYEPLVARVGDETRETSRAAEPDVALQGTELYHRACFAALKRRRSEE
jgi:DNA-directed RNA polymerase subunit N (RpoN/RPB10)